MPDRCVPGDSIEGENIEGTSRNPIVYKNIELINGIKCYVFVVSFNVKAGIKAELSKGSKKIYENSYTGIGEEVSCDKVVIASIKNKHSTRKESNASGTHSAFGWSYPNQTNVKIITSHKEILDAMAKRGALPPSSDDPSKKSSN
jgi:hypothetical protein